MQTNGRILLCLCLTRSEEHGVIAPIVLIHDRYESCGDDALDNKPHHAACRAELQLGELYLMVSAAWQACP